MLRVLNNVLFHLQEIVLAGKTSLMILKLAAISLISRLSEIALTKLVKMTQNFCARKFHHWQLKTSI